MTKLAVQVKNKAEFEALMQWAKSMDKFLKNGDIATSFKYNDGIKGVNINSMGFIYTKMEMAEHKILTFDEFAQLAGVVAKESAPVEIEIMANTYARIFQNRVEFWIEDILAVDVPPVRLEEIYTAFKSLQ